eukprot:scaffold172803_cov23-Tisochrysis_lutea.AAC.1
MFAIMLSILECFVGILCIAHLKLAQLSSADMYALGMPDESRMGCTKLMACRWSEEMSGHFLTCLTHLPRPSSSRVESRMSSHISMVLPSNRGVETSRTFFYLGCNYWLQKCLTRSPMLALFCRSHGTAPIPFALLADGSLRATSLQLDALEHASSGGRSLPPHAELQPSPSQQQHLQQDVEPTTPTARLKRHRSGRPLQGKQQKMSLKVCSLYARKRCVSAENELEGVWVVFMCEDEKGRL